VAGSVATPSPHASADWDRDGNVSNYLIDFI